MLLNVLIDKQDTQEIVRDKIAQILANNVEEQKTLAAADSKDPALWDFKVYTERADPFSFFEGKNPDTTPVVNVFFDTDSSVKSSSSVNQQQMFKGTFNIDCATLGKSANIALGGHVAGDERASKESQRVARLVRNILMSPANTYLDLQGLVWSRFVTNRVTFRPLVDNQQAQHVIVTRVSIEVEYSEYSPTVTPEALEGLDIEITRAEDGEVLAQIQTQS